MGCGPLKIELEVSHSPTPKKRQDFPRGRRRKRREGKNQRGAGCANVRTVLYAHGEVDAQTVPLGRKMPISGEGGAEKPGGPRKNAALGHAPERAWLSLVQAHLLWRHRRQVGEQEGTEKHRSSHN
ncbi:hypothetical protein NDU88_005389 [Pleurodeles waltl]|uniref:Uncharacterized protein n=1 Tax=Pleurodeles waltl TaxID=8319 RepID=A0AAV7PFD7_PLEWA|nr:hypothetical protein NDU88_005389 [Pleurodeles waltl]